MILSVVSATDNSTDTSVSNDIQSTTHEVEQTSNEVKDTSQSSQTTQNTQSDQQVQQDSKEVQQSTQTTEKTSQNTANSTKEVKTSTEITKNTTQDIQNSSQKASNTPQKVENNTTSSEKSNSTEVTINDENKTINETDYALNSSKDLKTASSYTADTYTDLYNQVELIKSSYSSSSSYTINLVSGRNYYVLNRINWGSSNYVKSLTINGNGAIINAIDNYEFLYINGGYSLTLNNVTITNTKNYNFIHNCGSLTLNNCMFLNNNYTIIYNSGTAVVTNSISQDYNSYSYIFDNRENLTVKNCSFKYTYKGSCIHNTKNTYIYNSTFSYNYASPIYSTTNSYTYINSSTFENNYDTYGGAIYAKGNVTVNNTVFKNNGAQYGGAIYGGNLTIDKSSFITNTATLGYPVFYTNIKAILSNSIICYENYAKSELMGLKDVIFESNNEYTYGSNIKYSTYIKTENKNATVGQSTNLYGYVYGNDNSIPSGSVTITVDGKSYTSTIGSDGYVHISYTFGSTGTYTVKISYAGSNTYNSSSSSFTVTVKSAAKINTYITTSDKTATVNKSTNLYGYVHANDNSIPSGSVTITVNGKSYTSTIGSDGYVHISYTFGSTGTYTVKISYAGSNTYNSSSSSFTVTIKNNLKSTTITASNQTAILNQMTTITATIKASDSTIPTGYYTITVNGTTISSYSISKSGLISFNYNFTKSGNYNVKISYAGNTNYQSSSTSFTVKVILPTSCEVTSYKELYNTIQEIKSFDNTVEYSIYLYDGNYKITDTINWGSTKGIKKLNIFGQNVNIYGSSQKQFLNVASGYTVCLYDLGLINCYATNGGSINNAGTLLTVDCVFNNSQAQEGGAIYNSGILNSTRTIFNNNQATKNGGSIYTCSVATTNIKNCTFNNNNAATGGAIYNNGKSTTINSSTTFKNNVATTGGAIYNKNYLKIANSTLTVNSAESGGAIYNTNSGTKVIVNNVTFNNNTALYGGAIFNYKDGNLNVTKSVFRSNQASNGEVVRNKGGAAVLTNNTIYFTSESQSNIIVTTDGKTTINTTIYNRLNKFIATININDTVASASTSTRLIGNITDSNNKLITDTLTVTFSMNGKILDTKTISNGKIDVSLYYSDLSSGMYNITTTIKETDDYLSTSVNTLLLYKMSNTITVSSITCQNGDKVTLTAYVTSSNGMYTNNANATFKLNGVTLKENGKQIKVKVVNGVAQYTYTIPDNYSAKDYKLTAVANVNGTRVEYTTKLTILKTDQQLTASTSMFVTGNTAQLTGTIVDVNGKLTTRDTKVAIKINGKTIVNTKVTNGKLDVKLDLSKYSSGAYTIDIVLGENGCYNTGYANMTLIKNMKNSIVVMPTNNTAGSNGTLYAFVTDSNGNRQSSGTVTFKIDGTTVGSGSINNGVANITYNTLQYYTGNHTLTVSTTVNGKTLTNSTTLRIKS